MSTLHLLCGLPGSGKTTLARKLERERPALRLCPDEWIGPLYGAALDRATLDAARDPVESVQWQVALRALVLGCDVVLENGFWSKQERGHVRSLAEAVGANVVLHFLEVPRDELWRRLSLRNADLPSGTFHVDEADLDTFISWFEPPGVDEQPVLIDPYVNGSENRVELDKVGSE